MNWPGMVSSAFESPFSDQSMQEAGHQQQVMSGKVPPAPFERGDIGEGLGTAVNMGLMGAAGELPFGRIAKGAQAAAPDVGMGTLKMGTGAALASVPFADHMAGALMGGRPLWEGTKQIGSGLSKGYREFKKGPPPATFGPTAPSPGTNARFVPGQYDAPRPQGPQPVNSSSLPEGVFPPPAPVPEPVPAPVLKPSGSMGKGPQAGYTPKPFKPEPINRKSLPEGVIPPPPAPAPEPVTPVPASVPGARFKPGQYDAKISKPPVETGGGHVPNYKYEGMGPEEFAKRSKEIDAERTAAAKAKVATIAPPPAPSAAAPLASAAEQSLPGGKAVIADDQIPVKAHETNVKVDQQIKDKVNNLAEYLRSKGGTPEHLDMIGEDPALTRQYLNEAHSYGKNKGNTVPRTGYKGLDKGSDSFKQVRQKIMDMIEEEKNKP